MLVWWIMTGSILDFQYCKSVLDFLHYLFNVVTKLISPSLNSPNRSQPTHLETQL